MYLPYNNQPAALNSFLCTLHSKPVLYFCHHAKCDTLALCAQCRDLHRTQQPSHAADQISADKTLQMCRNKLHIDLKNFNGMTWNYESQLKAYSAIQKNKEYLGREKRRIMGEIERFFDDLVYDLNSQNRDVVGYNRKQDVMVKCNERKNRIQSLISRISSQAEVREALRLNLDDIYEKLRHEEVKPLLSFCVYDQKPILYQIQKPAKKSEVIDKVQAHYASKYFNNGSPLHFLITEPEAEGSGVHFFDTAQKQLRIFDLKARKWNNIGVNPQPPEFGASVYDPFEERYYYFGGRERSSTKKMDTALCYDKKQAKWIQISKLRDRRSSAAATVLRRNDQSYILVAGGIDDYQRATKKCEIYSQDNPEFPIRSNSVCDLNFAAAYSTICAFDSDTVFKFGGFSVTKNQQSVSQVIQKYSFSSNKWVVINAEVVFGSIPTDYKLYYASACSVKINPNDIFIFGGYGSDNRGSRESYIFNVESKPTKTNHKAYEIDQNNRGEKKLFKYSIRFLNEKSLPFAEGFSRTSPVINNRKLYVLQNISDNKNEMLESERNLLEFDGYEWAIVQKKYDLNKK